MTYQVLARKWRPQKFRDVIGQRHITQTLQNAIKKGRIGHAYLFVGPRGIGKTTTARIFAKILNCQNPETDENGNMEPCCQCETCLEISLGNCLDVIEIDGASNNKVDDIRELRETVAYSPTNGRNYKVYIIDEVHMLTTGAWNALLKTLEEPPSHVKFLFATTEAHKVLPTIVSRCQRFDLKQIPISAIVQQLRQIATKEKIFIDDGALHVIARAADGGMRDAQSIIDQMIAFCGENTESAPITEADVVDVFGLASGSELNKLIWSLIKNNTEDVLTTIHSLAERGRNLDRLYHDILQYLRNILIFQNVPSAEKIVALSESDIIEFKAISSESPIHLIQRLTEGLIQNEASLRNYQNKRVFIETTLLRVMRESHSSTVDELITQLRNLKSCMNSDVAEIPEENSKSVTMSKESTIDEPTETKLNSSTQPQIEKPERKPTKTETTSNTSTSFSSPPGPKQELPASSESTRLLENHQSDQELIPLIDQPQVSVESPKNKAEEKGEELKPTKFPTSENSPIQSEKETSQQEKPKEEKPELKSKKQLVSNDKIRASLEKDPFVKEVCDLFDGKIVDVRG